jgi:hypothetical protein
MRIFLYRTVHICSDSTSDSFVYSSAIHAGHFTAILFLEAAHWEHLQAEIDIALVDRNY